MKHSIGHIGLAAVVAVSGFCVGCAGRDIPSDDAMTSNFRANEEAFAEMVALLQDFPSWEGDNPGGRRWRDGYWPEDTECREFLGEEIAAMIDSLLRATGCDNVHFRYCRADSCAATIPGEYSFTYHAEGLSIGPSVARHYVYRAEPTDSAAPASCVWYMSDRPDSIFVADGDLAELYASIWRDERERNDTISRMSLVRHINGNWYLELEYEH